MNHLKEQQTSDNLIVKDYCFITEIFDKGDVAPGPESQKTQ